MTLRKTAKDWQRFRPRNRVGAGMPPTATELARMAAENAGFRATIVEMSIELVALREKSVLGLSDAGAARIEGAAKDTLVDHRRPGRRCRLGTHAQRQPTGLTVSRPPRPGPSPQHTEEVNKGANVGRYAASDPRGCTTPDWVYENAGTRTWANGESRFRANPVKVCSCVGK